MLVFGSVQNQNVYKSKSLKINLFLNDSLKYSFIINSTEKNFSHAFILNCEHVDFFWIYKSPPFLTLNNTLCSLWMDGPKDILQYLLGYFN